MMKKRKEKKRKEKKTLGRRQCCWFLATPFVPRSASHYGKTCKNNRVFDHPLAPFLRRIYMHIVCYHATI